MKVVFVLIAIMLFIVTMGGLCILLEETGLVNNRITRFFSKLFSLDGEFNIPAAFSVLLIQANALLLFLIAMGERAERSKYNIFWLVLSMVFLFLSFDESWMIHDVWNDIIKKYFVETSGFLKFAWIIPYGVGLILFTSLLIPFLIHLPSRTRKLFLISGGIYVLGALGMEATGGKIAEAYGYE